jgi:hypothetical protein
MHRFCHTVGIAMAIATLCATPRRMVAQSASSSTAAEALSVTPITSLDAYRDARSSIALNLNRPLSEADGELVVLAGTMDVSALVVMLGTTITITPRTFELPGGESQLSVLRKVRGQFIAIGSFPLRIRRAGGFVRMSVTSVPFALESASAPARFTTRMQWTLNAGLSVRLW